MLEPSLCSKKTREYPLNQYYLRLKWKGSDPAQSDYMMQSDQVFNCLQFIITVISYYNLSNSPKTFERNQILFLHSVKVIRQEGHVTLDHSPEFSSQEGSYVCTDWLLG